MLTINLIKVGAIWLADLVNLCWNPFKRATYSTDGTDLVTLERRLAGNLAGKFVIDGYFSYQLPIPDDRGDAALFQGLYTAMVCLKNAGSSPDVAAAANALDHYFKDGILIRGIRADGTINDTTSNDSATGALFGLHSLLSDGVGGAATTIQRWAHRVVDSGYALTDLSGVPTKYGQLEQGWKTDPLRVTLLLAILALARSTEGGEVFDAPYDELYRKYRPILRYPKVKLLWWDTDYDTHRAAIHLYVLYTLTGDKVYADGLQRIHRITAKENNAWVRLLCSPALRLEELDLSILCTFTYEDRVKGAIQSINSGTVESVKWGDHVRARQALPLSKRGSQEFFWQRNMFSLDEWVGLTEAYVRHSGLDFLICYWLAKRHGII